MLQCFWAALFVTLVGQTLLSLIARNKFEALGKQMKQIIEASLNTKTDKLLKKATFTVWVDAYDVFLITTNKLKCVLQKLLSNYLQKLGK